MIPLMKNGFLWEGPVVGLKMPLCRHIQALRRAVRLVRYRLREREAGRVWRREGCPLPGPPHIKRALLRELAQRNGIRIFIETGTLRGDTPAALSGCFDELHSIELDPGLYREAAARFADNPKVKIWHGNSGEVLSRVLEGIDRPALFWLDGHYSGAGTARGVDDTPICKELAHIARHPLSASHLIVVDDARLFDGTNDYPRLEDLQAYVARLGFAHVRLENDLIVICGHPWR